jgi:hypothetical protein
MEVVPLPMVLPAEWNARAVVRLVANHSSSSVIRLYRTVAEFDDPPTVTI